MKYLTTREAAELLQVSESTVRRLCEQKRLAEWRTPGGHRRIAKESVERVLDERDPGITFP
jgi:excisionase family DNA binding protein